MGSFCRLAESDSSRLIDLKILGELCEDLELDWKDASRGEYLDVTHETLESEVIDKSKIISTRIGTETQIRD